MFVKVIGWELEVPRSVLPKFRLEVLAESKYVGEVGDEARIPVPETEMVRVPPF